MFSVWAHTNGQKDCTTATLDVETDLPCEKSVMPHVFECGRQYSALLLVAHIRTEMEKALQLIRRAAYEQGWKDGRARSKKKRQFGTGWNPKRVGW